MQWFTWWQIILALSACSFVAAIVPTLCDEEVCSCDAFTRVICNCARDSEIILRPNGSYRLPAMASGIILKGCARVHFLPDAVENLLHLRSVELYNIGYAVIGQRSLAWVTRPLRGFGDLDPGVKIIIKNSTIQEIASHGIQGRVDHIVISDSRINNIRPFAFSSLSYVKSIELSKNTFDNIETQSFKKFTTLNFIIQGGRIKTLPSRFLSDVEISNVLKIDGVRIDYIYSLSFLISLPKRISLENSIIGTLEGDAFHASIQGSVLFRNNTIKNLNKGAFLGLTITHAIHPMATPPELWIDNNTVTNITPESLSYNRSILTLRIDGLHLNRSCSCELSEEWEKLSKEEGGIITCWYDLEDHYTTLSTYQEVRCGSFKNNFWIYVVVGLIMVAIVAAAVIFIILKRENDKKKRVRIVMPDGKTYRETEFHIVVERAELLTTDL